MFYDEEKVSCLKDGGFSNFTRVEKQDWKNRAQKLILQGSAICQQFSEIATTLGQMYDLPIYPGSGGFGNKGHAFNIFMNVEKDIPCGYLPTYCARAVAEQAILLMLALLRKIKKQIRRKLSSKNSITSKTLSKTNL